MLGGLAALWGASYLLIKYGLRSLSPAEIVFGRSALAAVVLALVIRVGGGEARAQLSDARRRPGTALLLGLVAIAAPFLLISYGEVDVPSGLTAVLIAPVPLFVAMFAPVLDRSELIGRRQAVGLAIGLAGVALLVGVETVHTVGQFLGALAVLGASASYALASFVVQRAYRGVPALTTSFFSVTAGALLTLPVAAATARHHVPRLGSVAAVLVLGALGTALAFVVFYRLIKELGAGRAALVSYLAPGLALVYGAVFLDEHVTLAGIGGLLLILAGVSLASRGRASAPEGGEEIAAAVD